MPDATPLHPPRTRCRPGTCPTSIPRPTAPQVEADFAAPTSGAQAFAAAYAGKLAGLSGRDAGRRDRASTSESRKCSAG